jgi:hypothetical protein
MGKASIAIEKLVAYVWRAAEQLEDPSALSPTRAHCCITG